jgi:hypothetical protein
VITRIGLVVVVTCSMLAGISPSAASAKDGSTKDGSAKDASFGTVACGPGTKLTAHDDLRKALQIVSRPGLIGDRTLWTVPLRAPEYGSSTRSWVLGKQAWFRLEDGPVTVTGKRVDGGAGTFRFDMPPVESYPLALNANIGPGFIPSSLEFSTGGCWKVTARLGRSQLCSSSTSTAPHARSAPSWRRTCATSPPERSSGPARRSTRSRPTDRSATARADERRPPLVGLD